MTDSDLSAKLQAARDKQEAIAILQKSQLPTRFRRGLLQTWAQGAGVTLTPQDFAAAAEKV